MKQRRWVSMVARGLLVTLVGFLALSPTPVLGIANPDSPPELTSVYVYDLDDGGIGIIVYYHLHYTPLPTIADPNDTATNAYIVSFLDIGGAPLRAVAPYSYHDSGYGEGVAWIRFSAAEVATLSIDSIDEALYSIRLEGNPTLPSGWAGAIPQITASITDWHTTGDPKVLLAQQVLNYATALEPIWTPINLIESTALGNRLATAGEDYFMNVVPGLQVLAPAVFAASESTPVLEDIDYDVTFSATATSGSATVAGSPQTLVVGVNTVNTGATTGTMTITLSISASGTIADGTGTFIGVSPSDLVAGANVVTVDGAGTFTVTLTTIDLQSQIDTTIDGTGFDTSNTAAIFGMTKGVLSTTIWLIMGVVLIAATYGGLRKGDMVGSENTGKNSMFIYGLWMLGGMLLGIMLAKIMVFLFIAYGVYIGYIIFYRNAGGDTGKNVAFMGFVWVIICLAGGLLNGLVTQASTRLTANLTSAGTTITVASTEGFRAPGILVIGNERIAYAATTPTTFIGTNFRPVVRGTGDTEAVAHSIGETVRMPESSMLNDSMSYRLALISDSAGLMSFITVPLAIFNIITDFMFLPLSFLGTDLVILTILWGIVALGTIITFFVAMAGGRRI